MTGSTQQDTKNTMCDISLWTISKKMECIINQKNGEKKLEMKEQKEMNALSQKKQLKMSPKEAAKNE